MMTAERLAAAAGEADSDKVAIVIANTHKAITCEQRAGKLSLIGNWRNTINTITAYGTAIGALPETSNRDTPIAGGYRRMQEAQTARPEDGPQALGGALTRALASCALSVTQPRCALQSQPPDV